MDFWADFSALFPMIAVGLLFWFIMRAVFRADKTERKVLAKYEAEERAKRGL
ncbi:hypothetical protein [Subtercola endophyticus]|uniref:hypothetical protein n=1 Tax=Subtercola endophyticus TaxID=2895559 RepID=UPI001E62B231|nr:hypothetical protein [Subtercola endophyticus]UFS59080.1 hypothetical protein LQ955_19215 [Subtercola endophyticus]